MAVNCEEESNFPAKLIKKIVENEELCDVKLCFGGDEYVLANKTILGMVCPKFIEMFKHRPIPFTVNLFNQSEEGIANLKLVLQFIYRGAINTDELSDEQIIGVYAMSQDFKYPELTSVVSQALNNIEITMENVGKLLRVAYKDEQKRQHSDEIRTNSLLSKCWEFMDNNSEIVIKAYDVFATFPHELVLEIIKRDTFYADEVDIFNAIVEWGERNPTENIQTLLPHLRLKRITAEQFGESIRGTGLISDSEFFAALGKKEQERLKKQQRPVTVRRRTIPRDCSLMTIHTNNLATEALGNLLFDEHLSDVNFKFSNGETISAHKVILATSCPHFEEIFRREMQSIDVEEVNVDPGLSHDLFCILLNFIYGKPISLSSLGEDAIIELFALAHKLNFVPMVEIVAKRLERLQIQMENVGKLYGMALDYNFSHLRHNCIKFIENNAEALIDRTDIFADLPKEVVEKIVEKNMTPKVFEALKEWKQQHNGEDMSNILSSLPLETISPQEFYRTIRPTGLVSDEQYFEAHSNKQPVHVDVINTICNTHPSEICKAQIKKIFNRQSAGIVCNEISTSKLYKFGSNDESIHVEFTSDCVINTIKFRLFDQSLRLFNYEVQVGLRRDELEVVKPYRSGRYYTSYQEIVFQPKHVKYVRITSKEKVPLEIHLDSIEGYFSCGFNAEDSPLRYNTNLVANVPIDEVTKKTYGMFNCSDDEAVYMLRYQWKVSTIGIHLLGRQRSHTKIFTKENINAEWQQQAASTNLDYSTVVVFKESQVSFIKLKGANIKNMIKCIECPATAKSFPVPV